MRTEDTFEEIRLDEARFPGAGRERRGPAATAMLLASALLLSAAAAKAFGADYGPELPPGIVHQEPTPAAEAASGWWSSLKEKMTTKVDELKQAVDTYRAEARKQAIERTERERLAREKRKLEQEAPAAAEKRAKEKRVVYVPRIIRARPLPVFQAVTPPRARIAKVTKPSVTQAPAVQFVSKRPLLSRSEVGLPPISKGPAATPNVPGAESVLVVGTRPQVIGVLATPSPANIPAAAYRRQLPLRPAAHVVRAWVPRLPHELMELCRALLAWLLDQDAPALAKLERLALKPEKPASTPLSGKNVSQVAAKQVAAPQPAISASTRQKALAFTGWLFGRQKNYALGSFYLGSALASPGAGYESDVLIGLGKYSRDTVLARALIPEELLRAKPAGIKSEALAFLKLVEAERQFDRKDYAGARKTALSIPAKTAWSDHGRYLAATTLMLSQGEAGYKPAGQELTELFRTVEDQALFDATAMSLGEIHFILGNYKAAHEYLRQVTTETNVFIEAAIDNGWALLRGGNRNEAVGNMFTLHTPNFEGAYMPESYFIQSLGYKEICQFGDAMTAVKKYKLRYLDAFNRVKAFNKDGKAAAETYYADLVGYLSKAEHQLPGIVARELGRQPHFFKRQKALNAMARESRVVGESFPEGGPRLVAHAKPKFEALGRVFRGEIAQTLRRQALVIEEDLKFLTANMALLEYEIYAGASQNLSLQGAKNFALDAEANRKPAYDAAKEYWPYEDEIWEDELNNFRSKMVDACAKKPQVERG